MNYRIWEIMDYQGRSMKWLAERTGYSYVHVRQVKIGLVRATDSFKRQCELALQVPADILFSLSECAEVANDCAAS